MKKELLGLAIVAALLPAVASAEGGYIGGSIGQTEMDISDADKAELAAVGVSVDDTDTGFKLFAGYRINENFAVEGFYADLGEISATDGVDSLNIESDSFGASVLGIIPVAENFDLFAKIGFHAWDAELSSTVGVFASADGTDSIYGFGAAYTIEQVSFRAEFERYELDSEDVDMISAGIAVNF